MAKRKSLHIKGMSMARRSQRRGHRQYDFSSPIGKDAKTGVVGRPDEQAAAMFRNLELFMQSAGATTADIAYMKVYLKDEKYRDNINRPWEKMFPDEHDRPARPINRLHESVSNRNLRARRKAWLKSSNEHAAPRPRDKSRTAGDNLFQ